MRKQTSWPVNESTRLRYLPILVFIPALATASYLFRMAVPMGKEILGFPTLSYLAQYLSFYVLGAVAYRRGWFGHLSQSMGVVGFLSAAAALILLFPLAFSGSVFSIELSPALYSAMGNGHWQSAVYAAFDSVFAVGICLALIALFRSVFNRPSIFGRFLSQQSYTVYIIHIPIVIIIAYALRGIGLTAPLKLGLASAIMVPACFAVAYMLRKIPGISKIL